LVLNWTSLYAERDTYPVPSALRSRTNWVSASDFVLDHVSALKDLIIS